MHKVKTAAVIGAGLVGQGWAIRFAAAGITVKVFDVSEATRQSVKADIARSLADMHAQGVCAAPEAALGRIEVVASLEAAVEASDYVQESVLERLAIKQSVSKAIDAALPAHAVVGSSTSGIPASAFTEDLQQRDKFFVVHPVNPPHLIPLVEIVPTPWSDAGYIDSIKALLERISMQPILVEKEVEGFILNRLQGALLNEAWALYDEGYASAEDIEKTIKYGLGRRWAFMGPFETIALNAPDGIADYAARLAPLYHAIAQSRTQPKPWSPETAAKLDQELSDDESDQSRARRLRERDAMLMRLAALLSE